jgi:peptide/nickel transport system substrate-binding protein
MSDVVTRADRERMNLRMFATRLTPFLSLRLAVILAVLAAMAALVIGPSNASAAHSGASALAISAACDSESATPGETLTCRVRVSNTGGIELTGLFLLHYPYQTDRPTENYAGYPPLQLGDLATHESLIMLTSYTVSDSDLPGPLVQTFGADSDQTAEVWAYAATPLMAPSEAETESAPRSATVAELQANAEAFEYAVGTPGGSVTYATIGAPLTLNLALANDASSIDILSYLFEGLTEISWLDNQVEPSLAQSWEHSDDGLTWTFHLRRDVTWHDGQPFTAHDVDFTYNRIIYNDDIPANSRASVTFRVFDEEAVEWREERMTVRTIDDYTLQFVLPVPFAPFLRSMTNAIYPKHILEPYVDDGTFDSVWDVETDPTEIIGTGPFTIETLESGNLIVLKRNPNYWLTDSAGNRLPYLDEVRYLVVDDFADELTKFRSGETDAHGVLGEEFAMLDPLQETENFTLYSRGPTFGSTFLTFNMNPGSNAETGEPFLAPEKLRWFENTRFRQAVSHAVDKAAIIRDLQHGLGYPQWAFVSPAAGDFHNPNVQRYEYDIETANAILDGLGWTDRDGDGIREDYAGNNIRFTMATNAGNDLRLKVLEIVQHGLTQIGIQGDISVIEFGEIVDQLTSSYEWESILIGFGGGSEPHFSISFWHSSESLHLWNPNQSEPATTWEADIDSLFIRGSQELDREERARLYHEAQRIAADHVPVVYTTHSERLTAIRNVFGNLTPTLFGLWDTRYVYRTDL